MEGPLEIKDSTTGADKPVKSEAPVQNSDSSERSDAASSPPNCSICLGKLVNKCFTDSCLHQFCFTCLLQWSKIKTECPLCKQTFKSIIHNVRSLHEYDQYLVPRELASQIPQPQVMATLDVNFDVDGNWDVGLRRFFYRTTMTGNRRPGALLNPEQVARREQLPSMALQVPREEQRRRRNNPVDYRRTVYRHGIWATSLPDIFGRFRECSAEFYRRQPRELERLIPWLNRELQVLLNNEPPHIAYVLRIITDALTQYDIRSSEFRGTVRPYFHIHTDHFVHELLNFARTNFDLVGYDQSVTYLPHGLSNEYVPRVVSPISNSSSSSSATSENSDVRILDEAIDLRVNNPQMPLVLPHSISMPGPSTVGAVFHMAEAAVNVPEVLILSSSSSGSDNECEVIGYVKPRHERTPEIIELLSSDPEHAIVSRKSNENAQPPLGGTFSENLSIPSTSYSTKKDWSSLSCSTTSVDTDSDSDYKPRQSRRSRNRSSRRSSGKKTATQKRKKSNGARSERDRNRRSRNLSTSEESDFKKKGNAKNSKNRICSSSDSSSSESSHKKCDSAKKQSKKVNCNAKSTEQINKEEKRNNEYFPISSDGSSSAETDSKTETNRYYTTQYRSKRKRSSTSSNYATKNGGAIKNKHRTLEKEKLKSYKKDQKYNETRQSRSRSTSESSHASETDKKSTYRHREPRNMSEYESQDDSASMTKEISRRDRKSKTKKKILYSSDSEDDDRFRSNSQCSNNSNKSYLHWKRSKHKEKHKDNERHKSDSSRTINSPQSNSNTSLTKNDVYTTTKHSDFNSSNYKAKEHRSRKMHKESKHRESQNEKNPKPKKRRRRVIRSYSTSNSG